MADDKLYLHEPWTRSDGREGFVVSDAQTGEALGWHSDRPGNVLDRATWRGSSFETMTTLQVRDRAIAERGVHYRELPLAEPPDRDRTREAVHLNEPGAGVYHERTTCPACHSARGRDQVVALPPAEPQQKASTA